MDKAGLLALSRQIVVARMAQVQKLLEAANPGKADEVGRVMPQFAEEFDKRMPELVDLMARVYAVHFSSDELTDLIAFYDSAVGRKLVKEQSTMVSELQAIGMVFGIRLANDVLRKMQPELDKRNLKIEPQKT